MTKLHKEIEKKAKCSVLDLSLITVKDLRKDILKRLNSQKRELTKLENANHSTAAEERNIIQRSISDLEKTYEVLISM